MKKLLTVLLTVMLAFTTFGANIFAIENDAEQVAEEALVEELPAAEEEEKAELPEEVVQEEVEEVEELPEEEPLLLEVADDETAFTLTTTQACVGDKANSISATVSTIEGKGKDEKNYSLNLKLERYSTSKYRWEEFKGDSKFDDDHQYRATITIFNNFWNKFNFPFAKEDSKLTATVNGVECDITFKNNALVITAPITVLKTVEAPKAAIKYNYDSKVKEALSFTGLHYRLADPQLEGHTNEATNAGTYYVDIVPEDGYVWKDSKDTTVKSIEWKIAKAEVVKPSAVKNIKYNGEEKTGVNLGKDKELFELTSGVEKATNVKENDLGEVVSYEAVYTLKDSTNYKWKDVTGENESAPLTVSWKIDRKELDNPRLSPETIRSNIGSTAEIEITNYVEGATYATVSYDGHGFVFNELDVKEIADEAGTSHYYIYLALNDSPFYVAVKNKGNFCHKNNNYITMVSVYPTLDTYKVDDSKMTEGDSSATIKCTRDFKMDRVYSFDFLTIVLGDETVTLEKGVDYTVEQGSTKVTFKEAFLDTLAVGEYEIGFHYTDGVHVEGKLVVNPKPAPAPTPKKTYVAPKTGVR